MRECKPTENNKGTCYYNALNTFGTRGDVWTPGSKGLLEKLGADERIILKRHVKEIRCELDCTGSGRRQMAGSGECGNGASNSIT